MKNKYFLALFLGVFSFSLYAQFEFFDDFDTYTLNPISGQSTFWRSSSGVDGEGASVVDLEAFSGSQSLFIGDNGLDEIILLVPSAPTYGLYTIEFMAYIPAGKSGYFNMQAVLTPEGVPWNDALMGGNVFFNCDGASPGLGIVSGVIDCTIGSLFNYPEDQWFKVTCVYELDYQTWDMYIDDVQEVNDYPFAYGSQVFNELAGLNFYSASANNQMYIDNVSLGNPQIGIDNFSTNNFSIYPNPVKDVLNIKSKETVDNVIVYDILGKVVLQANPGTISPSINMSSYLTSGSYLVQVTINGVTSTVKVLK